MNNTITKILTGATLIFLVMSSGLAQTKISGKVTDAENGDELIGVNILVQGTVLGTITDVSGEFALSVNSAPPLTLVITSIGYERQELEITSAAVTGLNIQMNESFMLGQEVVVSASRVEESILQSPVSIEKMDILAVQNTSSDTYYKAIANLKGVDVATSSINFQIINARGFGSTGNTRFVQLIDGMDTQAPALNFPIGNLNGPSELDVESVELIPGASSALYGPSAFNGVLLINSKSPFDYQGASAFVKMGVNHVGSGADQDPAPMYEASVRYAKAFNDKFAFKVNFSYSQADDWRGTDLSDRNADINPFVSIGGANPGADRLHLHGDEAGLNMNILRFSTSGAGGLGWQTIASTGQGIFFDPVSNQGATAWGFAGKGFLPNHVITTPGYQEANVVDYGAQNMKINTGLYYRINDQLELSGLYNAGFGTSIYTGAQRYSLSGFGIQQARLQLRGDNFFARVYGTFENSGDSYIAEFLTLKMNTARYDGVINNYFTEYPLHYLNYIFQQGYRPTDDPNSVSLEQQYAAHQFAQQQMNTNYPLVEGSAEFNTLKNSQISGTIPDGPLFADKSAMYHAEAQYDFKNEIDWMELQVGGSFRIFNLNSQGTIFPDTTGAINISEFGIYAQAGKRVNEKLKFSGSLRFDKNENFEGQFNPRISGVYTVNKNHNFRASFQTGFRFPTTQGQYIDLDVISERLVGGLPQFYEAYDLPRRSSTGEVLSFTGGSIERFREGLFSGKYGSTEAASVELEEYTTNNFVKPEQVRSIELGYKSLIQNRLLIDAVYFHNTYTDFISQLLVVVAAENTDGTPQYSSLLSTGSDVAYNIYTNLNSTVKTQGAAVGLTYSLDGGYTVGGNYSWNKFINGYSENTLNDFNTPEHKFNLNFGNRKLTDNLGFNITYRWQEAFRWESSFAEGDVPAYSTLDAQVSYRLKDLQSVVKVGGSNLLGEYYLQSLGGPNIGAIYYISVTFDQLMN